MSRSDRCDSATRSPTRSRPGCDPNPSLSPSLRRKPSSRCISSTAVRLDSFDRGQRFCCLLRLARHDPTRRAGLHSHDAHVVRHDIVQLAGDPHPLGEHRLLGVALPFPHQLAGALGELRLTAARRSDRGAEHPRRQEDDGVEGELEALGERVHAGHVADEKQLPGDLEHDRELTGQQHVGPERTTAVDGGAVERDEGHQHRDRFLGHVHHDPGHQERRHHGDRRRPADIAAATPTAQ